MNINEMKFTLVCQDDKNEFEVIFKGHEPFGYGVDTSAVDGYLSNYQKAKEEDKARDRLYDIGNKVCRSEKDGQLYKIAESGLVYVWAHCISGNHRKHIRYYV